MTTRPSTERSRLDPDPMPRRDFLGIAAFWSAMVAGLLAMVGIGRLPRAAVLPSPSRRFRVQLPESLTPGSPFLPPGRAVAVIRDRDGGVFAISTVCTHLGCIVKEAADGFHCPCHGSRFGLNGELVQGPAPKGLPWLAVTHVSGDMWMVDEDQPVPAGTKVMA